MKTTLSGYYFITDRALSKAGNISDVRNAVSAGVSVVQYRDKNASSKELFEEAAALRALCKDTNTLFLVNDRLDIALAVNADGVHIGQDDMPFEEARRLLGRNKVIGVTAHTLEEAVQAWAAGADYIGVSPIFATRTKADAGKPSGIALVEKVKSALSIPVVAIGGITLENAPDVVRAGADSLCAISAVITKDDVKAEIEKLQNLFKAVKK